MSIGKKVLFGVALLLCASLAFAESVRVKAANVNVRSSPVATAKVVAKVPQGKMLEVIEVSGQWTRITDGAITGWVSSALLERVAEAPAAAPASGSSGASRSSSGTTARSSAPPPARRTTSHKAASNEKPLHFALNADLENNSNGLGVGGRVLFAPVSSLPALSIMGAVDLFPIRSNDAPTMIQVTANGVYGFRDLSPDLEPYVGAGLVWSHVSGDSSMKLDIMGGVMYKQRFFADLRIVLADGTPLIISAGIRF